MQDDHPILKQTFESSEKLVQNPEVAKLASNDKVEVEQPKDDPQISSGIQSPEQSRTVKISVEEIDESISDRDSDSWFELNPVQKTI